MCAGTETRPLKLYNCRIFLETLFKMHFFITFVNQIWLFANKNDNIK